MWRISYAWTLLVALMAGCFTAEPIRAASGCTTEICDGLDNDCNGKVDDGPFPDEQCDGVDNDCDGTVDEGGICPLCEPTTEVCNGKDDDCDGSTDEGLAGTLDVCDGVDNDCDGTVDEGSNDVCDGLDNDCDGTTDEGSVEVCDGIDNDCDTEVDEGFAVGTSCDGADENTCFDGVLACASLSTTMCVESYISENLCLACQGDRDPRVIPLASTVGVYESTAVVVPTSSGFAAAYVEGLPGYAVRFVRLDERGTAVGTTTTVTPATSEESKGVAMASNGSVQAVVWMESAQDATADLFDIHFQLVDATGALVLATPLNLSNDALRSWFPKVAWVGDQWMVIWECETAGNVLSEPNKVCMRRVAEDGTLTDTVHVFYAPTNANYSARELGIDYLASANKAAIVWKFNFSGYHDIYACIFTPTADACPVVTVVSDGFLETGNWPSVVAADDEFGFAWDDNEFDTRPSDKKQDIVMSRRTTTGAQIGTNIRITSDTSDQRFSVIGWDGSRYVFVYRDNRLTDQELYMRTLTKAGSFSSEVRLTRVTGDPGRPQLTARSSIMLGSWVDPRPAGNNFDPVVSLFRCVP